MPILVELLLFLKRAAPWAFLSVAIFLVTYPVVIFFRIRTFKRRVGQQVDGLLEEAAKRFIELERLKALHKINDKGIVDLIRGTEELDSRIDALKRRGASEDELAQVIERKHNILGRIQEVLIEQKHLLDEIEDTSARLNVLTQELRTFRNTLHAGTLWSFLSNADDIFPPNETAASK